MPATRCLCRWEWHEGVLLVVQPDALCRATHEPFLAARKRVRRRGLRAVPQ